jgi:hypothetical protein
MLHMFIQDHGVGITADNAYAGLASQYHVSSTEQLLLLHTFCAVVVIHAVVTEACYC